MEQKKKGLAPSRSMRIKNIIEMQPNNWENTSINDMTVLSFTI